MRDVEVFHVYKGGSWGLETLVPIPKSVKSTYLSGCESKYIKVSNRMGLKLFKTKINAQNSFKRQKTAVKIKRGPEVHSARPARFAIKSPHNGRITTQWGFFVQHAHNDDEVPRKLEKAFERQALGLCEDLENIGISTIDVDISNSGLINNRLVCLDFGDLSCNMIRENERSYVGRTDKE